MQVQILFEYDCYAKETKEVYGMVEVVVDNNPDETEEQEIVILVDTSGSMWNTLYLVRAALELMFTRFANRFSCAFVTFASQANVVFPMQVVTDHFLPDIMKAIHSIVAQGNTNLEEGLRLANAQFHQKASKKSLFLVTDGRPTVGELFENVEAVARHLCDDVDVFALGIGSDCDDALLDRMCINNNGMRSRCDSQEDLPQVIGGLIAAMVETKPVSLQVICESGSLTNLSGRQERYEEKEEKKEKRFEMDLGNLFCGEIVHVPFKWSSDYLFDSHIVAKTKDAQMITTLRKTHDIPIKNEEVCLQLLRARIVNALQRADLQDLRECSIQCDLYPLQEHALLCFLKMQVSHFIRNFATLSMPEICDFARERSQDYSLPNNLFMPKLMRAFSDQTKEFCRDKMQMVPLQRCGNNSVVKTC